MHREPKKKRPNLRDVSRAAEVSVATVSRVLNTPEVVNKDTRSRVEAVIEELGFVRSAAAFAINSGRTRLLGALIPNLESDIFSLTVSSIEQTLVEYGFSLIVATTDDNPDKEARKAKELVDVGVEGFFVTGVDHSDALYDLLRRVQVPAVAISYFDQDYRLPTVGYDNRLAATQACAHLIELGHQRIAVVHGPLTGNDRTKARVDATRDALSAQGCEFFEEPISVEGGVAAARRALAQSGSLDAILCMSDPMAFGVLHELHRCGVSVPKDVSVVSIHNLPASEFTHPPLTTVHLPARQMGKRAAECLARWVEHDERPSAICLDTYLVQRSSATSIDNVTNFDAN
ncbi:MAG: LacI family DNA-binding transcriptional regulator [Pseudomonadota bacterium]